MDNDGIFIEKGYFMIARQIFESKIWGLSPDILKLFIYLIGNARHGEKSSHYAGTEIQRGELFIGLSKIIEDNTYIKGKIMRQWSRSSVSRMLHTLADEGMIELMPNTSGTHIKVCNYKTYQDWNAYKRNDSETIVKRPCNDSETIVKRQREHKKNEKKGNNGKNEKNEKEKNPPTPQRGEVVFPEKLNTPEFKKIWAEWEQHRKEIKHPLTPTSEARLLKKLANEDIGTAIEMITQSLENGWRGIFALEDQSSGGLVRTNEKAKFRAGRALAYNKAFKDKLFSLPDADARSEFLRDLSEVDWSTAVGDLTDSKINCG